MSVEERERIFPFNNIQKYIAFHLCRALFHRTKRCQCDRHRFQENTTINPQIHIDPQLLTITSLYTSHTKRIQTQTFEIWTILRICASEKCFDKKKKNTYYIHYTRFLFWVILECLRLWGFCAVPVIPKWRAKTNRWAVWFQNIIIIR